MVARDGLRADDRLRNFAGEMQDFCDAELCLHACGINAQDPLEGNAAFLQRPFIEACVGKQEKQRDIIR